MAFLEVRRVVKAFGRAGRLGSAPLVLGGVDLSIEEGEFVSIVGYSGSGKTTLVSIIGGLLAPDEGEVRLGGERVTGPGPERGIVFQQYSLLPWMTVRENVALAVDAVRAKAPAAERRRRTSELIDLVGLTAAAERRPGALSGGMRQRVAVARGLAMEPRVLLLDEPFSALDALTRATLQDELQRICGTGRCTVILVTNDVDEAILLSDRIHPLTAGPGAVLGPAIEVALPRPRERKHLSLTAGYQRARMDLVDFLRSCRHPTREDPHEPAPARGDLRPGEELSDALGAG